ncbi:hypothetical protein B0H13DRAFT_2266933 [Mycena leptocephala]|nr:hypothetical protein B0H13DRAFT_2266933 [Mycena leptocephala]
MTSSASSKSPAFDTVLDDAILPVLNLAKTCVTGIGIPGVEALINSVLELATMILLTFNPIRQTMTTNKDDLSRLEKCLNKLTSINASVVSDDLTQRLKNFTSNLKAIADECKLLAGKSRLQQFFKSKDYKERLQGIRASIASHIQEFTFYGNISIEKSVDDMVSKRASQVFGLDNKS